MTQNTFYVIQLSQDNYFGGTMSLDTRGQLLMKMVKVDSIREAFQADNYRIVHRGLMCAIREIDPQACWVEVSVQYDAKEVGLTTLTPSFENFPSRTLVQPCTNWRSPSQVRTLGTVKWEEFHQAYNLFKTKWPGYKKSLLEVHNLGGFSYATYVQLLGHPPESWQPG